jgi:hypothetical protein
MAGPVPGRRSSQWAPAGEVQERVIVHRAKLSVCNFVTLLFTHTNTCPVRSMLDD